MKKEFLPFDEARSYVRKLKLKNLNDWQNFCNSGKRPDFIPSIPSRTYKNKGWKNLGDFLGTGYVAARDREYRSINDARSFVRKLGLKNVVKDWNRYCNSGKLPKDIPRNPQNVYKKEWTNWGDFLGTGRIADQKKQFLSFSDARKFVKNLGFKNNSEWRKYYNSGKKPNNIPSNPDLIYKKEWTNWGDFLGTGNVYKKDFLSFEEARKLVHKFGFKFQKDWLDYCKIGKKPENIPSAPHLEYKNVGWINYGDWLGTGNIGSREKWQHWLPYQEAKKEYQKLAKQYRIKNATEWRNFVKTHDLPKNLPPSPWLAYSKQNIIKRLKKK